QHIDRVEAENRRLLESRKQDQLALERAAGRLEILTSENDRLREARDQSRAWAAAWKRAARRYRNWRAWWENRAWEELQARATLIIQQGKREVLLESALRGLLNCSAYREFGHCGQCEQRAHHALKGADHD
ncbi:MAG: hypothetical protein GWN58_65945, partial [Anaerolineae bacterium]|nr:hypothetical protein [Anaerolineae bacterium]